jgi:hypothetical protein
MVGVIFAKRHDWTNALRYMLESLWIDAEETDIDGLRNSFWDLGTSFVKQGDVAGEDIKRAESLLADWQSSPNSEAFDRVLAVVYCKQTAARWQSG